MAELTESQKRVAQYEFGYAGTRVYMGKPVTTTTVTPSGAPVAAPHTRVYEKAEVKEEPAVVQPTSVSEAPITAIRRDVTPPTVVSGLPVSGRSTIPMETYDVRFTREDKTVGVSYYIKPALTEEEKVIRELEAKEPPEVKYTRAAVVEVGVGSPYVTLPTLVSPKTTIKQKVVAGIGLGTMALPLAPAKVAYPIITGLGAVGVATSAPKALKGDIPSQVRLGFSAAALGLGAYGTYRTYKPTYEVTKVSGIKETEFRRMEIYEGAERPKAVTVYGREPSYYEQWRAYSPEEIQTMIKKGGWGEEAAVFKDGFTFRKGVATQYDVSFIKDITKTKPQIELIDFLGKGKRVEIWGCSIRYTPIWCVPKSRRSGERRRSRSSGRSRKPVSWRSIT